MKTSHAMSGGLIKAQLLYWRRRWLVDRDWKHRHDQVLSLHPEYAKQCGTDVEKQHGAVWRLLRRVDPRTLRICANISGRQDPDYVPEEVFATEIERSLNCHPEISLLANKTVTDRWFPKGLMPATWVHGIDGDLFDGSHRLIDPAAASELLRQAVYPLVIKPTLPSESGGGRGVSFVGTPEECLREMSGRRNYVVQEFVRQHPFFERLTEGKGAGINTLRVCTYRSVKTGAVHFLHAALRLGKGGSLDNETAGGIVCYLHEDGRLHDFALDKYGGRYDEHPDTGIRFSTVGAVPEFQALKNLAVDMAQGLPLARVISFDLFMDEAGRWRLMEVNLYGHTIRFFQYAGVPFFKEFTHEVLEYCRANPAWMVP